MGIDFHIIFLYNRVMSANPTPVRSQAHTLIIVEMLARGYQLRTIKNKLKDELSVELTDTELLQYLNTFGEEIDLYREQFTQMTLTTGLADISERVRRLSELAENYEDSAMGGNTKAAGVYLKTLSQIKEEMQPLGITIQNPNDPWIQMVQELQETSRQSRLLIGSQSDQDQTKSNSSSTD